MANELKYIPLAEIRENPNALRQVNRQTEEYQGLVESIRKDGVMNPIVVRECVDPNDQKPFYSLIDGLHRFTASKDAGKENIPCHVTSMEDAQVLSAQIIANVQKIETKAIQYSKQLVRILCLEPLLTEIELAGRLSKSPAWLRDRLGLLKLEKNIQPMVDEGKINLSNAYALAKLPESEQANFLDRAMTMQPPEFIQTVHNRAKELREAARQGRQASTEFQPVPVLRKLSEIKTEAVSGTTARELVAQLNVKDPVEAFKLGINWALNMDPVSVSMQKERDEARKKELEEAKEARKKERLEKAAREAAEKAAQVSPEVAMANTLGVEPLKPVTAGETNG